VTDPSEGPWLIDCTDGFGRPAQIAVRVREGVVTLQWPPGEAADLTPEHAGQLHRVLLTAGAHAAGAAW
jgi:hypothetical protein